MLHPRLVRNRSWPVYQTVSISVWISWPDRRFLLFRVPSEFFNPLPVKPFVLTIFIKSKTLQLWWWNVDNERADDDLVDDDGVGVVGVLDMRSGTAGASV